MYSWVTYLHVLCVFSFLIAHGISAGVAFALRKERDLNRIQALLNLSSGTLGVLHPSILLLLITGIIGGFAGKWWGQGWIWLSIGLLVAIYMYMGMAASSYYGQLRQAAGLPWMKGFKLQPAGDPAPAEQLDSLLTSSRPMWLAVTGFGAIAIITWLMIFKPF